MRHFPARATAPCVAAAIAATTPATASSLQMIYQGSDYPSAANLMSPIPSAYGQVVTGAFGGAALQGQLFVLVPGKHGSWTKILLHTFTPGTEVTDGAYPNQNLVADKSGNVWGTTSQGGANNTGTVFELIKPASKTASWTYRVAASLPVFFESPTGSVNLVFDRRGNLFGTSAIGCSVDACGSVFEVTAATLKGGSGPPKEILILPRDLGSPPSGLTIDPAGNLYATTYGGGSYSWGTVWEASPGKKGQPYGFQVIHSFCSILDQWNYCVDGYNPVAGVTYSKGMLYGTTIADGGDYTETNPDSGQPELFSSNGLIFALTPPQSGGAWGFTPLHPLRDYIGWNVFGPDFGVHNPLSTPEVSTSGGLVFSVATGGIDGGQSNVIYGAALTVDPVTGNETIVNNDFAVEASNLRSGPIADSYHPFPVHRDAKNRVFGQTLDAYDTGCGCYNYWGAIYMITP
jgi:hypothetical protein